MKRHGDDDYGGGFGGGQHGNKSGKRQRPDSYQEALAAGKYELRLLVSSRGAGGIIGKGGENIKRMRSEYDATITVPDSQTPERITTIVGTMENVLAIVSEIVPKLDDNRDGDNNKSELRMLVHQSHAGAVIGRGGSKIKEIREETEVHLKVYAQCPPQSTERVVQITGSPEKISACVSYIINMLKDIPLKGLTKPYESMFYDPSYSSEYGGFPPDRSYHGPMFRAPMGQQASYGGGGGGGGYNRGFPPRSMGGGRGPLSGALAPFGGPEESTQVTIPNELGGTIIGKGGERINRVREESGGHILVGPQQESGERIITITGNSTQIQTAQYLLQQCVRQSVAGRRYLNEM